MTLKLVHSQEITAKSLGKQLSESKHSISNGVVAKLSGVPVDEIKDHAPIVPCMPGDYEAAFDQVFAACEEIQMICEGLYAVARERKKNNHQFCDHAIEVSNAIGVMQGLATQAICSSERIVGGE